MPFEVLQPYAAAAAMTPDIAVIIVNYNSGPHLTECLTSLSAGLAGFNWQVVVVVKGAPHPRGGGGGDDTAR